MSTLHEQRTCETSVVPSKGSTAMSTCTEAAGRTPLCPGNAPMWTLYFLRPA